jgi:hypothetical protein
MALLPSPALKCYRARVRQDHGNPRWAERAVALLDRGRIAEAEVLAEEALVELTADCGDDLHRIDATTLLRRLGDPERGRALARAFWLASVVDELVGRRERAAQRCYRGMELYARLRIESEELDVRAARELGSASARLGATTR